MNNSYKINDIDRAKLKKCKVERFVNRDGEAIDFDIEKIYAAIYGASRVNADMSEEDVINVTNKVIDELNSISNATNGANIYVEKVQDIVEKKIADAGFFETSKAYILYRKKRDEQRSNEKAKIDVEDTIEEYLKNLDWRINENANIGYSIGGLILKNSEKLTANYWLSTIYPKEIAAAHKNADFHIHDLGMLTGYCAGWSLRQLLAEGFNGVPGYLESSAPKHLTSAVSQMVNFFGVLQNEWAGAQAFSSVDTYLAPFVRVDKLSYKQVYQNIQELIFNLSIPCRWGTQTPFTNFTFDIVCPKDVKDNKPMIGGEEMDFTYGDLQEEMDMVNKAYIEVMTKGDIKGRPFTFPIPTYNITHDMDWDSDISNMIFGMAAKYGTPYFQNFLNSDLKPTDVRSMCCRLQMDLRELKSRMGGLFGSGEQTGSIGVVTVNCARLGYLYKGNKEALYYNLDHLLELAKNSLEIKRKTLTKFLEGGLYPYTRRYLGGSYRTHFSTIGVNGMNEMIRNFTDDKIDITSEEGVKFAEEFLTYIRDRMVQFQEETGNLYNLEATPAEGTTYRFAKEDDKRFEDIIQAGFEDAPYYTNSSQIPVGHTDDPFEALELQDKLQTKYTGGTVLHLYMSEAISSSEVCKNIIRKSLETYRLPYISVQPTFSVCPKHGYLSGHHEYCPKCDEELAREEAKNN
ncbi:MAG: ribonucleoside triphosphate reductase [Alphaproteobacteria bacterium]|jgi:ribonucleoside-triphosphate reductase|nr:ribonucleoside triphosphate reductase [Alphaproteobacteria bacterium]